MILELFIKLSELLPKSKVCVRVQSLLLNYYVPMPTIMMKRMHPLLMEKWPIEVEISCRFITTTTIS